MPDQTLKSFAKRVGKSIEEVEDAWLKAKEIAKDEKLNPKDGEKYWSFVMGMTKKLLGVKQESIAEAKRLVFGSTTVGEALHAVKRKMEESDMFTRKGK